MNFTTRRIVLGGGVGRPTLDLDFLAGALDNRITLTRAGLYGTATHFDSSGTLQNARVNIALQSADMVLSWIPSAAVVAVPVATATAAIAPDGTNTGIRVVYPQVVGGGAVSHVRYVVSAVVSPYTFSVYLKGNVGGEQVYIYMYDPVPNYSRTLCTLTTEWQRFSVTAPLTVASWNFAIGVDLRDGGQTTKAAQTIYAWGAQVEQGSTASPLIPTVAVANGAPRFDYDPATLAPRGLLIEEARTNILTNSQAINSWPIKTDTTITDNSTTSPDGTVNASLCTEGVTTSGVVNSNSAAVSASAVVTWSVFLKRGNTDIVRLIGGDTSQANGVHAWVNLATGAILSSAVRGTATAISASIQSVGNGWYRVAVTATLIVSSTVAILGFKTAVSNGSTVGVANGTYYAWGAQTEVGAASTSYIPTTASSVARAMDVATMPLPVTLPASIVADAMTPQLTLGNGNALLVLDDGTGNNRMVMRFTPTNNTSVYASGGSATASPTMPVVMPLNAPIKMGAVMQSATLTITQNGMGVASASGAAPLSMTTLRLGSNSVGVTNENGWLRRVRFWPRALADAQLQSVTR